MAIGPSGCVVVSYYSNKMIWSNDLHILAHLHYQQRFVPGNKPTSICFLSSSDQEIVIRVRQCSAGIDTFTGPDCTVSQLAEQGQLSLGIDKPGNIRPLQYFCQLFK